MCSGFSSTVMRIGKKWTNGHRTFRKTSRGRRKMMLARDDWHMLHIAVNDRKASSWQLVARWSTATGVPMSASSIRAIGYMVWGAISYHRRSNLLRIECNLNIYKYVREVLHPEVVPILQFFLGTIFQQNNARPHVAMSVWDFCSTQDLQLLP